MSCRPALRPAAWRARCPGRFFFAGGRADGGEEGERRTGEAEGPRGCWRAYRMAEAVVPDWEGAQR
eukprot:1854391-Alexandrium_andersonii.AAC.1